jgi:signal transduction histidine kinase
VDGIFEFARAGAQPEAGSETEVKDVLDDVVAEVQTAVDPPLDVRVEPYTPCAVACDPGVLTSLLSNLVNNAVKYTQDSALRQITVRLLDRGERVRFEVEDTGPGLAQGLGENVFEPYVRAPGLTQPGLGLGLATVKRLSEAHGGQVGVRSNPGKGCVFWFELPKVRKQPAIVEAPETRVIVASAK